MTSSSPRPILANAVRWGGLFASGLAVVAGGVGLLVAGLPGLWAGLLGAALAFAFLALTALSMLIAQRVTEGEPNSPVFYGIVLGVWLLKLIVFFVFMSWLRGQGWLQPWVFFVTVIVAVIGSLVVDALAFVRSRTPYVDVPLPGDDAEKR